MKKLSILCVVALVAVLCTTAFAPASAQAKAAFSDDGEVLIGYSVMRMTDEYFNNQIAGMEAAVADLGGDNIKFELADAKNDAQTCIDNALSLIGRGADVLFISPPDPSAATPVVEAGMTAGIPVISCDTYVEGAYFLAHDDTAAGRMAGEYAAEMFAERFDGEVPVVALIEHKAAADPCQLRIDGFVEVFGEAYPDAKFLPQQDAEGVREQGVTVMNDIITANPDVNVVFSINDDMALGCVSAIESRNMTEDIMVFGQGGCGITTFEKVAEPDSPFVGTIAYEPYQMGYDGIAEMALSLLNGDTIEDRYNGVLELITKENVTNWLDA